MRGLPSMFAFAALLAVALASAAAPAALDRAPALVRPAADQVHLSWVGKPATTLTVVWRTRNPRVASLVEYRSRGTRRWRLASGGRRASGTEGTLHQVTLRSLHPRTAYEYRVPGDGARWSRVFAARTAPRPGGAGFSFVFVADTGLVGRADGLATGTRQVLRAIARLRPLFVLGGGDYAYFDTDKRYGSLERTIDAWFDQMQPIVARAPFLPTYGNHEVLLGERYAAWAARLPTPRGFDARRLYSFDVGSAHFVSLFAVQNTAPLPSAHVRWIERDIRAAKRRGRRWIVPFFHVSPFAEGTTHPSNTALRAQLGPLFERLGVDVVLSAHDQSYERTYPLRGVPRAIATTSRRRHCYTRADGVSWVKVSPGGKLSNISRDFSPWRSAEPPPWTAFRDNTMHHFARVRVSPAALRVGVYGVTGDGSPPVVLDGFRYTRRTCQR